MADARVTLAGPRQRIQAFVDARGWDQYHNLKDLALALSIEASELLELFLWRPPPEPASLSPEDRERIAGGRAAPRRPPPRAAPGSRRPPGCTRGGGRGRIRPRARTHARGGPRRIRRGLGWPRTSGGRPGARSS